MAVSPQMLAVGLVVGGTGIGVPVYLVTIKNTFVNPPRLVQLVEQASSKVTKISETSQEVSCGILPEASAEQVSGNFLKEQKKDKNLYSLASCVNAKTEDEDISLLGKNWSILLPKDVLNKLIALKAEERFSMNVQTILGAKNSRDFVTTIFSNPTNESSVRLRWVDLLDTNNLQDQKAILTTIEGEDNKLRDIYLLFNSSH